MMEKTKTELPKEFLSWWESFYGKPEEFYGADTDYWRDEFDEYCRRRDFAFAGWVAGGGCND